MSMAKNRNIDLGIPTEDLPEWTIDLSFVEKEKEEKEKEKITTANETVSAPEKSGSGIDSVFNSEFVLDGNITSPSNKNVGGLESEFNSFNDTVNTSVSAESDSVLGGSVTQSADDSISTLGNFAESDTVLGSSVIQSADDSISSLGTDTILRAGDESNATLGSGNQVSSLGTDTILGVGDESNATLGFGNQVSSLESDTVLVSDVQDSGESESILASGSFDETESSTLSLSDDVSEKTNLMPEAVQPEPVLEGQKTEPDVTEKDEVEEKLNHLVNSMNDWEQSENALSEAAAMLSVEAEAKASMEIENNEEDKELKSLFDRLDISESLDRMNAAAQEDIADVIEQTEKDNDLLEAINAMPEEEMATFDVGEQPVSVAEEDGGELLQSIDVMMPEEETLKPVEESVIPQDVTISNDMFDIGIDLSEDENFSDENIDLSVFKGSIKDADEFNAEKDNSIDLDAAEADMGNSGMAELDMSNLVAAAMSNLAGGSETMAEKEQENKVLEFAADEPEISEPQPEETESALEFMTGTEPEEETESTLEFMTGTEPEEAESTLEFMTGAEPETEQQIPADLNPGTMNDLGLEFVTGEESETEQEAAEETVEEAVEEALPEPEEIKLEFEPVYPNGEVPTLSGISDDAAGDDIDSLIIEDYSEVPTVSDLESKLKKQEKEKKRNKSKESHKNKEDGFAFSLDDLEAAEKKDTVDQLKAEPEPEPIRNAVVEAALEVAAETAAAQIKEQTVEELDKKEIKRMVIGQHVVHKSGMSKRSYYRLVYKND